MDHVDSGLAGLAGVSGFLGSAPLTITQVENPLTQHQQFRLIEIAHETKHDDVRVAALKLLHLAQNPLFIKEAMR